MNTKRIISIILLAALALTALVTAGCTSKSVSVGAKLSDNIARLWYPNERESRFVLNGNPIEGFVNGQAFLDPASHGRTAIAWVDIFPYFVSQKGVRQLEDGMSPAIVSFDGRLAVYQADTELRVFSAETDEVKTIAEGISAVQQIAVSPKSEAIAFTAQLSGQGAERHSKLYKDGQLTDILEGKNAIVMAVSDDASLLYYYDFDQTGFCVSCGGEVTVIAENLGSDTNFNFTNDLSEVAYRDSYGGNHLFRLSEMNSTDLGEGFQYTLKTDVYSVSTTSVITYINDVSTFTDGLWLRRDTVDGVRTYSIGVLDKEGAVNWLIKSVGAYAATNDGKRIVTLAGGTLISTDMKGKQKELAKDVALFAITDDGAYTYYISNAASLFGIKGTGKPQKLAENAASVKVYGGTCFCLTDVKGEEDAACGTLKLFRGFTAQAETMENVSSFDRRNGHVIVYTLPKDDSGAPVAQHADDGSLLCSAYFTLDGSEFKLMGENVGK